MRRNAAVSFSLHYHVPEPQLSLRRTICAHTPSTYLTGVTLRQPNRRCFSERRRWDGAPRPPRAYFTMASAFGAHYSVMSSVLLLAGVQPSGARVWKKPS